MAIEVKVGELKTQEEMPFPKLMMSTIDNKVYLFLKPTIGVPLDCKGDFTTASEWAEDWNMEHFIDHNEPITLRNK